MKKLLFYFSITSLLLLVFSKTIAQVSYSASFQANAGNPGGLYNLANDAPGTAGWTTCGLAGSLAANAWSPAITLPFAFDFYGTPVTQFKVSANGLLTFDATVTGTPPNVNGNLPDASLPNNTICAMWDEFTSAAPLGANDIVYYRVFGTAPNRQVWVYWYSYEIGNPSLSFNYWAAVLEETTNKVYVIDTYGNTTPLLSTTVGVQLNSTTATQFGVNNIPQAGNGTGLADNDVWTFLPQTPCTGTPAPGNTLSSVAQSCGGVNFTLSLSNSNLGSGVTYQWQSSSDGTTYIDIAGATNSTFVTQQNSTNYYQCVTTCSNGGAAATSVPVLINAGIYAQCLCTPATTSQASWVSAFSTSSGVSNFSYTSGAGTAGGYNNQFGNFTASNYVGATTNIAMTAGGPTCGFAVWIDWNNNATFETTERVFNTTGYVTTTNGSFLVPVGTPNGSYRMRVVTDFNNSNPSNPCATLTRGEYVDFTFNVVDAPSCLPPTALTTSSLTTTGVTVSWTAPTPLPDNGYQYIVSTTAGSPTAGATPTGTVTAGVTSVVLTGLTPNTTYYVFVASVCGSTVSSWSNSATFYTGYCVPAPTSVDGTGITNVTFGTINNTTGPEPGNYGDYSAQSNDVAQTTTATVLITYSTGFTYDTKIWVDWNDDLDFNDVGEEVYVGTSLATNPTTLTATFTVPLTAPLGAHRMRIGGQDTGPAVPCYTGSWGSYEDYTLNVIPAPNCLSPTALSNTAVNTSGATISWTAPSPAPDNGYQYFVSTTAGSPAVGTTPTGTVAAGTTSVVVTGLNANTTYYVFVASVCGAEVSPWSSSTSFYTGYCVPNSGSGCQFGDLIANVTLNTLSNNSGTVCVAAYNDYTENPGLTTTLLPSSTYNCVIGTGAYAQSFAVWIDYNDDLIFDASERVGYTINPVAANSTATFSIVLSCTPPVGNHVMRVRSAWDVELAGINVTPCGTQNYGEVEDYLITIAPAPTCPAPGQLSLVSTTTTTANLTWNMGCSSATNFDFEYGPTGFVQGTGTLVSNVSATINAGVGSYTLTGLTPNTAYSIYFRANCGSGDVSPWSISQNALTNCNPINLNNPGNQTVCDTYTLPAITEVSPSGNAGLVLQYRTQPNGGGVLITSPTVTTTQTIYIYGNAGSCSSNQSFVVTVNQTPLVAGGATNSTLCLGDSTNFSLTAGGPATFTFVENGNTIGTTSNPLSFYATPAASTIIGVYSTANGCSSDTLDIAITVNSPSSSSETQTVCGSYQWNGQTYTSSGVYTYTTQNSVGCDSTVTLNLTVNLEPTIFGGSSQTICSGDTVQLSVTDGVGGQISWLVNGSTISTGNSIQVNPTITTTYDVVSVLNNCISDTASFTVTVNNPSTVNETVSTCDTAYIWNNQIFTQSGTYLFNGQGVNGCDSTVILDLTFNDPISVSFADTACNSYAWNGQTYTETGVYTFNGQTTTGCDSTVTLYLVIQLGGGSYELVETCVFPYTWSLNGQTYNEPGLYFEYSVNQFGCDVYDSLNLVQLSAPSVTASENTGILSVNQTGVSYQWILCSNGTTLATTSTFTPSETGDYACIVTFASGCVDTSNCVTVDLGSLNELGFNLSINPNPSNGLFNLTFSKEVNTNYVITDSYGKLVSLGEIKGSNGIIDLSTQVTGVYFVTIDSNSNSKVFRIIKN